MDSCYGGWKSKPEGPAAVIDHTVSKVLNLASRVIPLVCVSSVGWDISGNIGGGGEGGRPAD